MKQIVPYILIINLLTVSVYSQEVDEQELSLTSSRRLDFIDNRAPSSFFNSAEQILGIGRELASDIVLDRPFGQADIGNKYGLIHILNRSGDGKLGADILSLGPGSRVDQTQNLKRIIAGYLQMMYGYDLSDALTLGEFVLYYNAVYRKNLDYFKQKYAAEVLEYLPLDEVGISLNYADWPGRSRLVIPVKESPKKGELNNVPLEVVSDDKVLETVKKAPDKGIKARKAIADLMDRSAKAEQKKLEQIKTPLVEKTKEVNRSLVRARRKEQADQGKSVEEQTANSNLARLLESKFGKLNDRLEGIIRNQDRLSRRMDKIQNMQDEIRKDSLELQKETPRPAAEPAPEVRKTPPVTPVPKTSSITPPAPPAPVTPPVPLQKKSTTPVIAKQPPVARPELPSAAGTARSETRERVPASSAAALLPPRSEGGPFFYILNEKDGLGRPIRRLALINRDKNRITKIGKNLQIIGKDFKEGDGSVFAVGSSNKNFRNPRLLKIEKSSLRIRAYSREEISPGSEFVILGDSIYAVVKRKNKFYAAVFDPDLNLILISRNRVHPQTSFVFKDKTFFVQSPENKILELSKDSLAKVNSVVEDDNPYVNNF